jgi:hypothetical protein
MTSTTTALAGTASLAAPPTAAGTGRLAARVTVVLLAAVAVVAMIVRLSGPAAVRGWLAFPFTGVPATLPESGRIFAHNARAMLGVFGLLLIAQIAARRHDGPSLPQRWLRMAGELLLGGVIAANLLLVGPPSAPTACA